jgi:hypothetical protein
MPRLSVLLPAHNAEATLPLAARSTLRDLPGDSELVVFDDGSTDRTAAVLEAISDPRLRVLSGHPPGGVAAALNRLLASTDSALVARMDADDVTLRGRFRRELRAIDAGADAVFTTVIDWRPDRRMVKPAGPVPIGIEAFPYHLLLTNPVSHPTLLARRAALEGVGRYREVPAEDYDLWLRLANSAARMSRLPLPGLLYRIHPAQVTSSTAWREASWTNPRTAQAFADLAQTLLHVRLERLTTLGFTAANSDALEEALSAFRSAFVLGTRQLPPIDRLILHRKLRHRLGATRAICAANAGTREPSR